MEYDVYIVTDNLDYNVYSVHTSEEAAEEYLIKLNGSTDGFTITGYDYE